MAMAMMDHSGHSPHRGSNLAMTFGADMGSPKRMSKAYETAAAAHQRDMHFDQTVDMEKERKADRQRKVQQLILQLQQVSDAISMEENQYRNKLATAAAVHGAEIS